MGDTSEESLGLLLRSDVRRISKICHPFVWKLIETLLFRGGIRDVRGVKVRG
jgi:hypothetical protein